MPDRRRHAPHLAVAAFLKRELYPGVRHTLAEADGRCALPKPGRFRYGSRLGGEGEAVVEMHALRQLPERFCIGDALNLSEVGLGQLVVWMTDAVLEPPVICQHQQAFAISIQSPGRVDVLYLYIVSQGRTPFAAELADHTVGLVEQYEHDSRILQPS